MPRLSRATEADGVRVRSIQESDSRSIPHPARCASIHPFTLVLPRARRSFTANVRNGLTGSTITSPRLMLFRRMQSRTPVRMVRCRLRTTGRLMTRIQ